MNKKTVIGLALIFGVTIGALLIFGPAKPTKTNRTTREVALACTTDMATQFHIHPTVQIMFNGTPQAIPANLGIEATCMTSIHTHDASGILHVESPEQRDFTLGDFFAVWKQPFDQNQLLRYKADATHVITVTVNGKKVDTFENTVMRDNDKIIISYGAAQP